MRKRYVSCLFYRGIPSTEGVALITAVALLLVFSILGSVYLRYMTLELEKVKIERGKALARTAAISGVQMAISEIKAAMTEKRVDELCKQSASTFDFPAYVRAYSSDTPLQSDDSVKTSVVWVVRDESSKLNLNHAPASALRVILQIDGAKAREICASLPRSSEDGTTSEGKKQWLTSLDDLVTRGFLTKEEFDKLDLSTITVYTVLDPWHPTGHLNLNSAPAKVLEAIFDISPDLAQTIVSSKRPFNSFGEVCEAVGKSPTQFNYKPDVDNPDSIPKALVLEPTAFRIQSRAQTRRTSGGILGTTEIETVVVFLPNGNVVSTYWKETSTGKTFRRTDVPQTAEVDTTSQIQTSVEQSS